MSFVIEIFLVDFKKRDISAKLYKNYFGSPNNFNTKEV